MKYESIMAAVAMGVFLVGCGNTETPEEVAKDYLAAYCNGRIEVCVGLATSQLRDKIADVKKERRWDDEGMSRAVMMSATMAHYGELEFAEVIVEGEDRAVVVFKYKDSDNVVRAHLKKENGTWKVDHFLG